MTTEQMARHMDDPERKANLNNARLPQPHVNKAFVDLKTHKNWGTAALTCATQLNRHRLSCVFGGPRTGKTQIGVTVGKTRVAEGWTVFYAPLSTFITDYEARDRLWEVVDDQYYTPGVLILDDCHLIHQTPLHHSWVDALLSRRMSTEAAQTVFIFDAHARSLPTYLPSGLAAKLAATKACVECPWAPFTTP